MTLTEALQDAISVLPALARITAVMFTAPILAHRSVPWLVRIPIALGLTLIMAPLIYGVARPTWLEPVQWVLSLFHEVLIGALLGLSLSFIVWAIRLAAELIENLCGFSFARISDSTQPDDQVGCGPLVSLYWWTMLAVFVAAGGVGQTVKGLLNSFHSLPVGSARDATYSLVDFLVGSITSSFELGLRVAMPALVAMIGATFVLALAQKNFPQLGGLQIGLGFKSILAILTTSLLLISAPWVIAEGLPDAIAEYQHLLKSMRENQ